MALLLLSEGGEQQTCNKVFTLFSTPYATGHAPVPNECITVIHPVPELLLHGDPELQVSVLNSVGLF